MKRWGHCRAKVVNRLTTAVLGGTYSMKKRRAVVKVQDNWKEWLGSRVCCRDGYFKLNSVDSESLSFEQRVPSCSLCFRKISLPEIWRQICSCPLPCSEAAIVALCGPAPSLVSSHITLSCSPHSCHLYLLSVLTMLFLAITHRLFPLAKMFFLPHFL